MEKWLRDLLIVTFFMISGALIGVYGSEYIYYTYFGNKEHICVLIQGAIAVILVNIVIYTYIIINHTEDFRAVFCNKREEWIKKDKEENEKLIRSRDGYKPILQEHAKKE